MKGEIDFFLFPQFLADEILYHLAASGLQADFVFRDQINALHIHHSILPSSTVFRRVGNETK